MADFNKTLRMAERFGMNRRRAANMRIRYLKPHLKDYRSFKTPEADIWAQEIQDEINYLNKFALPIHQSPDKITDDMIEQARSYPIDALLDFSHGKKVLAWCHDDTTPSVGHLKRINKAKCFACDKVFDSIDVAMSLHGLSFKDAVKHLTGG